MWVSSRLDVHAPVAHARDMAVEELADFILHELHHFVLDRGAFGFGGDHFPLRGVYAEFLEGVAVGRFASFEVAGQQPVDHHVRVAADRRGEMRVVGESEAVMTDVVGRVESLGHRTYGEVRNDVFLDASFGLSQQACSSPWPRRVPLSALNT